MTRKVMMTPDMMAKLHKSLLIHEDDKARAYLDIYGNITAGLGHNLSARDIASDIRERWFKEDSLEFYSNWINTFPWFLELNPDRQVILIDFSFMGWKKVLEFTNMLDALAHKDYESAAHAMLDSEWAKQVKTRAPVLAEGMLTGVYNP